MTLFKNYFSKKKTTHIKNYIDLLFKKKYYYVNNLYYLKIVVNFYIITCCKNCNEVIQTIIYFQTYPSFQKKN